jgi:beta-mannosidase
LIESYYNRVFKQVIPEAIHRHTNVPYEHTSPLSNWGKDDYYNHGTQHYWGVWHGKDPMADFAKKIGRFNAEYGFQSFPEFSTLATFSDSSEWSLNSEVMKHHQKSYVGNGMIAKHADLLFGRTSDFKRFVYYSQLTQARAVSMAVVGHRMDFPRCTGTIYWQYNDCWPAPTWSSIDYNNNWKALQYQVREDYRDVAVLTWYDSIGKSHYSLLSDSPEGFSCRLHCSVYDDQGQLLETWNCQRAVLGAIAQELFVSELKKYENENVFLLFSWNDAFGNQFTKSDYRVCNEKKVVGAKSVSYEIANIDADAQTAVLVVKNKEVIQDLWITSTKLGVHFDSNFVDLIPGEHRFEFTFRELPQKSDLQLFWR